MKYQHQRHHPCVALRSAAVLVMAAAFVLAGCGDKKGKMASQTAVKVNKEEITVHQINYVLQQQRGLKPEQAEAASKQILERLIDQELALQRASEMKLDRDPRVMQQLEAAKREIVARAYMEKTGETAAKPTTEEVKAYYEAQPALFKDRRIYNLQEISIEATPDQLPALKAKLEGAKNITEFIEFLKAGDFKYTGNQAVRSAEQLPLSSLGAFAAMKDGQAVFNATPTGAQVVVLASSRTQPVTLEQATPAIEQFLLNERKREIIAKDMKAMRDAATIEYVGKFALTPTPAPTGNAPPPATPAPAAPSASGALDASSISKGMGLK